MFDTFGKIQVLNASKPYIAGESPKTSASPAKNSHAKTVAKNGTGAKQTLLLHIYDQDVKLRLDDPNWGDTLYFENPHGDGAMRCDIYGVTKSGGTITFNADFSGSYGSYSDVITTIDKEQASDDPEFQNALEAAFPVCEHEQLY